MKDIFCENPTVIYNRACTPYVIRYGYVYGDSVKHIRDIDDIGDLERYFSSLPHSLTEEELDKYGYVDEYGVWYPLFIKVPCRHCLLCRYSYSSSVAQRIEFQSNQDGIIPSFVTLTYKDDYYVDDVDQCKRDIQLYKKRMQTFCRRNGFQNRLKFVNVIERGGDGRLHHHFIIMNMPRLYEILSVHSSLEPICKILLIHYLWRNNSRVRHQGFFDYFRSHLQNLDRISENDEYCRGICHCRLLDSSKNAAKYVSTYISASRVYCSHNIGVDYAKILFNNSLLSKKNEVEYYDIISCTAKKTNLNKYYIDKFLPSVSKKFFPTKIMRKIAHFHHNVSLLASAPIAMVRKHLRRYLMFFENIKHVFNHIHLEIKKLPITKDFFASYKINSIFAELENTYYELMHSNYNLYFQRDNFIKYKDIREQYLYRQIDIDVDISKAKIINSLSKLKKYI